MKTVAFGLPFSSAFEPRPMTLDSASGGDWLLNVSSKHLPHYVNEFVFRFNRRRKPMAAFQSLLGLTTQHAPTTHKMLYMADPSG